jgi:hypothetical protein
MLRLSSVSMCHLGGSSSNWTNGGLTLISVIFCIDLSSQILDFFWIKMEIVLKKNTVWRVERYSRHAFSGPVKDSGMYDTVGAKPIRIAVWCRGLGEGTGWPEFETILGKIDQFNDALSSGSLFTCSAYLRSSSIHQ